MFDKFGRTTGFGQIAPGRDIPRLKQPGQPGRPPKQANITQAVGAPMGFPQQPQQPPPGGIAPTTNRPPVVGPGQLAPAPTPTGPGQMAPPAKPAGTLNDVLLGAMRSNLSTIHAAQGDAARKAEAEKAIRSVLPQLQAMGVQVEDVKNEKIKIGGRWLDLLRDVDGDAEPQVLDVTDHGAGGIAGLAQSLQSGVPGGAAPTVDASDYASNLREQIMRALQVNPQLAALGSRY